MLNDCTAHACTAATAAASAAGLAVLRVYGRTAPKAPTCLRLSARWLSSASKAVEATEYAAGNRRVNVYSVCVLAAVFPVPSLRFIPCTMKGSKLLHKCFIQIPRVLKHYALPQCLFSPMWQQLTGLWAAAAAPVATGAVVAAEQADARGPPSTLQWLRSSSLTAALVRSAICLNCSSVMWRGSGPPAPPGPPPGARPLSARRAARGGRQALIANNHACL